MPRRQRRRTARTTAIAVPIALVLLLGAVSTFLGAGALGAPRPTETPAGAAVTAATTPAPSASASTTPAPSASTDGATTAPAPPTAAPAAGTALEVLAALPVKGRAPMTGYQRTERFGAAWLDVDRNGCDTRNDVLRRDLVDETGSRCRVLTGVLHDPYTGRTIDFVRGEGTSTAIQIDHVVALADAWRTGAQGLSQEQRIALANDPANLFAVDGPTNSQKSDGDAATWLPPAKAFRCTYVAHQVGVKHAYGLWVTPAEKAAMERVLAACPDERAPASGLPR